MSTIWPYNFSFCTHPITKCFGFLSVQLFLLYSPNHKIIRLSVGTTFPFASTKSQIGSAFCSFNASFCTNQSNKMVRFCVRTVYHSELANSQKGPDFCPYNFSCCTSRIIKWFRILSVQLFLLYQPNNKWFSFCPYIFSFFTNRIGTTMFFSTQKMVSKFYVGSRSDTVLSGFCNSCQQGTHRNANGQEHETVRDNKLV